MNKIFSQFALEFFLKKTKRNVVCIMLHFTVVVVEIPTGYYFELPVLYTIIVRTLRLKESLCILNVYSIKMH